MPTDRATTGRCLCGRVTLAVSALRRDVVYCHCSQCRRQSGHYYAATEARDDDLTVSGEEHLTWYAASPDARRGFCRHCGSVLFWKRNGGTTTAILAGCLDAPTDLAATAHIFVADRGDYYEIADDLPRHPGSGGSTSAPPTGNDDTAPPS